MPREAKQSLIGMPQSVDAPGTIPTGEWPLHSPSKPLLYLPRPMWLSSISKPASSERKVFSGCRIAVPEWNAALCLSSLGLKLPQPPARAEEIDKEEPMTDQARAG